MNVKCIASGLLFQYHAEQAKARKANFHALVT